MSEASDRMDWNASAIRQQAAEVELETAQVRRSAAEEALEAERTYWKLMNEAACARAHRETVA